MISSRIIALAFATAITIASAAGADESIVLLEEEFARLAHVSGGTMGVAAVHIETGRAAYLNPDDAFPMASTFKVPVAVALLEKVDHRRLSLQKMVRLHPGDLSPGSGTISRLLDDPGVSLSVLNLLELMLLISDNSAADLCMELAGGPEAVTKHTQELGLNGIRVDRSTLHLIADYLGAESLPARKDLTLDSLGGLFDAIPDDKREAAANALMTDPRDTATPRDMAKLLQVIWRGDALSQESAARLRDIMLRCETGAARLRGLLPQDTPVAHKTGTIGGTTNDVGVITLPNDAGTLIVVAFVKASDSPIPERERAIAEVARAAHDYFLFHR